MPVSGLRLFSTYSPRSETLEILLQIWNVPLRNAKNLTNVQIKEGTVTACYPFKTGSLGKSFLQLRILVTMAMRKQMYTVSVVKGLLWYVCAHVQLK